MNAYIIVEGAKTEPIVIPKWLKILAPGMKQVDHAEDIRENNYYLFNAGGIPAIYNHIANAIADVNTINAAGRVKIDYLLVHIDTEEESREYILEQINKVLTQRNISVESFKLEVFEQKVSMETWFLGNRKIFKANPDDEILRRYVAHYNVKASDPELMPNYDEDEFSTKAQFHHSYLKKLFKEQHIKYAKKQPGEVCKQYYLDRLIERCTSTTHLASFARWHAFVISVLAI